MLIRVAYKTVRFAPTFLALFLFLGRMEEESEGDVGIAVPQRNAAENPQGSPLLKMQTGLSMMGRSEHFLSLLPGQTRIRT